MQVGMVWYETETLSVPLVPGVYEVRRVYTNVYADGDYEYAATYNPTGE